MTASHDRILLDVPLQPVQGQRFQPTGFPDLGPATFVAPNAQGGQTQMLLVESAQSVANRLEVVCWDAASNDLVAPLRGMPYVAVRDEQGELLTTSLQEAHRLNSPYILEGSFKQTLMKDLELSSAENDAIKAVDIPRLARTSFRYDPNSVIHGIFLAQQDIAGGRYRLPRLLSGFIEASNIQPVQSGGVKNDRLDPRGSAKDGFGNVPYPRTEFAAATITAYFNLDLAALRGYRIGEPAEEFLITLAYWKIRRFLETGLRLRTACDLVPVHDGPLMARDGFILPSTADLTDRLPGLIATCAEQGLFATPPVTGVTYNAAAGKRKRVKPPTTPLPNTDDGSAEGE